MNGDGGGLQGKKRERDAHTHTKREKNGWMRPRLPPGVFCITQPAIVVVQLCKNCGFSSPTSSHCLQHHSPPPAPPIWVPPLPPSVPPHPGPATVCHAPESLRHQNSVRSPRNVPLLLFLFSQYEHMLFFPAPLRF